MSEPESSFANPPKQVNLLPKHIERFWENVNKNGPTPEHCRELGPCWEWSAGLRGQYGRLRVGKRNVGAHRVSWTIHYGEIPDGMGVLHRCDNPKCVNPCHLFTGTITENNADNFAKGRRPKGMFHPMAILNEDQVRTIRARRSHGEIYRTIASDYGVTIQLIYRITTGRCWVHLS